MTRSYTTAISLGGIAGIAVWTATEYTMHRWILHGPFGRGALAKVPLGSLHRAHHVDPAATDLAARLGGHLAMASIAVLAAAALGRLVPVAAARAAAGAWSAGYSTYEVTHWQMHHRAPRTSWGEKVRRRHLQHHFGGSRRNLGVTTSCWDRLLGTEASPGPTTIPRRHVPDWLTDSRGRIQARFAEDFALTGD